MNVLSQNPKKIFRRWTAEETKLLGTASDEDIASRLGRTVCAVFKDREQVPSHSELHTNPENPKSMNRSTASLELTLLRMSGNNLRRIN